MAKKDGWHGVVDAFKAEGVKYVFGLPGGLELFDALYDAPEIRPIQVRHEEASVFMAMANARLTGEPSVCHGTLGPGIAQMIAGILEAYSAALPVIIPCPSVPQINDGKGAFQECDQLSMLAPITKWSIKVTKAEKIPWAMRRAFSIASNGKPGPVFIDIPKDVGVEVVDMPEYIRSDRPIRIRGDLERIKEATELILKAERPVIVAGGGAVSSRAFEEIKHFVETLYIPILTTPCGRGIISEGHPLALGQVGLYRTRLSKKVYEEADLLIGIGTRFEEFQSGAWQYFPKKARFIQIDIDPFEIGRNWIPDVAIVGDAKLVLEDLVNVVKQKMQKSLPRSERAKEIEKAKKEYEAEVEAECRVDDKPIRTKRVIKSLNNIFGANTILVNENGSLDLWSYYYPYYAVRTILGCIAPAEQTCMGFGVAGAIGAKITRPDMNVVCTTGDGAFQMQMNELATAVQNEAPVTWIILNNFSLGWPKYVWNLLAPGRETAVDFEVQPDFAAVAESNRCYGERIENPDEVEDALKRALKANREGLPAVLDFIVKPLDYNEYFKEFHLLWGASPASISG